VAGGKESANSLKLTELNKVFNFLIFLLNDLEIKKKIMKPFKKKKFHLLFF
jgi:hypothetical protein